MKLDSKLFDRIRIVRRAPLPQAQPQRAHCDWAGCDLPGLHKAPRGHREPGHFMFCLEHVRQYNKAYNYFANMDEDQVENFILRAASTGERPTWRMGTSEKADQVRPGPPPRDWTARRFNDPFNVFARYQRTRARGPAPVRARTLVEADQRALEMLGLEVAAEPTEIKSAYKSMVKKHHPDANGGDKGSEERLRNIIAAYTHLKSKGFA